MFVHTWSQDVKGSGIRINMLSPGAIDTPSLCKAFADASGPENVDANLRRMGEGSPLGRLGDPREIGKAAVFLSSDQSSFITGVELFVDGASPSPAEIRLRPQRATAARAPASASGVTRGLRWRVRLLGAQLVCRPATAARALGSRSAVLARAI